MVLDQSASIPGVAWNLNRVCNKNIIYFDVKRSYLIFLRIINQTVTEINGRVSEKSELKSYLSHAIILAGLINGTLCSIE